MELLVSGDERPAAPAHKRYVLPLMPPPVRFYEIRREYEGEPREPVGRACLRDAPGQLLAALDDVLRIWWRKFFTLRRGR